MLSVVVDGEKKEAIPERGLYKTQIDCTNSTTGKWDYNAWNLILENVSEQAKCNITFTTNGITEAEQKALIEEGKTKRRNTYRGKDITEYYTDGSLYEMISSGRFDYIYVGDYIKTTHTDGKEYIWLIADLDNYLYSGSPNLTKHHATIIPATNLGSDSMNDTATTEGSYIESKMATVTLPNLVANDGIIGKAFGTHILEYSHMFSNKVNPDAINRGGGNWSEGSWTGASSGYNWYTRKIDLMSEINVFGTIVWSSSGYDVGIDNRQYAIFQLKPEYISNYGTSVFNYWLKSVASTKNFADVAGNKLSNGSNPATTKLGIRPKFLIG